MDPNMQQQQQPQQPQQGNWGIQEQPNINQQFQQQEQPKQRNRILGNMLDSGVSLVSLIGVIAVIAVVTLVLVFSSQITEFILELFSGISFGGNKGVEDLLK